MFTFYIIGVFVVFTINFVAYCLLDTEQRLKDKITEHQLCDKNEDVEQLVKTLVVLELYLLPFLSWFYVAMVLFSLIAKAK